jgi:hypothetical protein
MTASPERLAREIEAFIEAAAPGGSPAVRPDHRVPFHWPPRPVSLDFHLPPGAWSERATLELDGETFPVEIARTSHGVFGRAERLWNEARGTTVEEVLDALRAGAGPLLQRQAAIAKALGRSGRFSGPIRGLDPLSVLKLLYCEDRDVAAEASREIESRASSGLFSDALVAILRDRTHPMRRSAQWCVLDMFEDLPSFFPDEARQQRAIDAVKDLMWDAEDDFARTVYKAGVVLGGHVCTPASAEAMLACLDAPSKIGRRSAYHAVFHLAEWMPDQRERIVAGLRAAAAKDPEPLLRAFGESMARDVEAGSYDHMDEPVFPDEA